MTTLHSRRFKLLLLGGIVLVAAFLRLYRIDSLPPGDYYDPAYYGLDALSILRGARPIFLPENYGREPMFSYLVAAFFGLFGVSPKAIYAASAAVGILTIPAVYLMAEEMFAGEEGVLAQFGGLVAALAVAISYWHLNWSRLGVRAILVPFFVVLTLFCLWRGLRMGNRRAFVGCGVFLGLGMYTYQAFRALPLLVVLAFVYVAVYRRARNQVSLEKPGFYLANLAIVVLLSLIIFAPLGYYFLTHPGSFFQRIEQTIVVGSAQRVTSNAPHGLSEQVKETLLMFNFHGDEWPKTNLPGRPALDPFLSVAFLLGIGVSLRRIRKPLYLFLLTWLVVMTVPAFLAQYGPAAKRAIGTLPAAVMLVAVGALVAWDWARRWAAGRSDTWARALPAAVAMLIGAGFLFTGIVTFRDYFIVWGQNPDLFTHFEAGESAIGRYVGQLPAQEQVYISPVPPNHPSVVFNSQEREGLKGYNGRVCVVAPERTAHDTTWVIVPRDDKNSLDLLARYYPQGEIVGEGPLHYNQPFFLAYEAPAGVEAHVEPAHPLRADFDNQIQLLGYDLDSFTYQPGDTLQLFLYYRRLGQIEKDYTVSTQLLGPHNPATNGPLWAQDDSEPCRRFYPTSIWDEGEVVRDQYTISIPADTPSGDYTLITGFYDWQTLERLPVLDAAGQVVADNVILGQVHVTEHE
ncbi:MAG: glycosyltransferase family 39 protein [Anaerolineae bacterium]